MAGVVASVPAGCGPAALDLDALEITAWDVIALDLAVLDRIVWFTSIIVGDAAARISTLSQKILSQSGRRAGAGGSRLPAI